MNHSSPIKSGVDVGPPSRLGRPSVQDSQKKVAAILDAARELFCTRGFRAVTMRQVADTADVSTRTLYNRYADKLSLFTACLDFGSTSFPLILYSPTDDIANVLTTYAAAIVEMLSGTTSRQLGLLIYREGAEVPGLVIAAEASQDRYMVQPLGSYLIAAGLGGAEPVERAKIFIAMAISEWQRGVSFRRPLPSAEAIARHAASVTRLFLDGAVK